MTRRGPRVSSTAHEDADARFARRVGAATARITAFTFTNMRAARQADRARPRLALLFPSLQ